MTAPPWAREVLAWRTVSPSANKMKWTRVPNNADIDNRESIQLAAGVLYALQMSGAASPPPPPVNPGDLLERYVEQDLAEVLPQLTPNRQWRVQRGAPIMAFAQYAHLADIDRAIAVDPNLRVTLGRDYTITPDVTVAIYAGSTRQPFLHAAVSCKWTIRSDRVQNIRHEFNQMIKHRRGRQPHLVTVTAEPLPTRIAAIARGTGEVDAVYHVAFSELDAAVAASQNVRQQEAWAEVVGQGRLLDYNQLSVNVGYW